MTESRWRSGWSYSREEGVTRVWCLDVRETQMSVEIVSGGVSVAHVAVGEPLGVAGEELDSDSSTSK